MSGKLRAIGKNLVRLFPRIAYPVLRGPLRGARFVLGSLAGEGGGASVYWNMVEVEQTEALLNEMQAGQIFYDIGANVGYYTVLSSRLAGFDGRVVAVEPVMRNLIYLKKHIELNKASNVIVFPVACSDKASIVSFVEGDNCARGRIANLRQEREPSDRQITYVPTLTVDEIVEKTGLIPQVMKIDVEGAELLVLKGASKLLMEGDVKIFLSTHSEEAKRGCQDLLAAWGYSFVPFDRSNMSEYLCKKDIKGMRKKP